MEQTFKDRILVLVGYSDRIRDALGSYPSWIFPLKTAAANLRWIAVRARASRWR